MSLLNQNNNNQQQNLIPLATLLAGRTKEQQDVIRYFYPNVSSGCGGCLGSSGGKRDDAWYMSILKKKIESFNLLDNAIERIGIDKSQIEDVKPYTFGGYSFDDEFMSKYCKDLKYRSSGYCISIVFVTDEQVFFYSYTFDMASDYVKEVTHEYFLKDIVNISCVRTIKERRYVAMGFGCCASNGQNVISLPVRQNALRIMVPGDYFDCYFNLNNDTIAVIDALRAKIREKKSM